MTRFYADNKKNKRLCLRAAASRAVVLGCAFWWFAASHASPPEFALLPALESGLAEQSLLLDVTRNDGRLLVAGEQGHILYSDDDGRSWTQADVPISLAITSVAFSGSGSAWATAHDGFLLHSADSGTTWEVKLTGSDVARLSVGAVEAHIEVLRAALADATPETREDAEWALEDGEFALEEAMAAIDEGMTAPMLRIWFANDSEGFALGAYGVFLRTDDGGETWVAQSDRLDNPDKYHLYDIARSSAGTLLVAGEAGTLLRSLDNGGEWERVETPYPGSFFGTVAAADGSLLIFGLRGNVFRSTDEGASWTAVDVGDQRTLMCGTVDNDGSVVLAGSAGVVHYSDDDGANFRTVPTDGNRVYSGVSLAADGEILLVGFGGISVLESTTDVATGNNDE